MCKRIQNVCPKQPGDGIQPPSQCKGLVCVFVKYQEFQIPTISNTPWYSIFIKYQWGLASRMFKVLWRLQLARWLGPSSGSLTIFDNELGPTGWCNGGEASREGVFTKGSVYIEGSLKRVSIGRHFNTGRFRRCVEESFWSGVLTERSWGAQARW